MFDEIIVFVEQTSQLAFMNLDWDKNQKKLKQVYEIFTSNELKFTKLIRQPLPVLLTGPVEVQLEYEETLKQICNIF